MESSNRCIPHCSTPCINGICIAPEKCSCLGGYAHEGSENNCLPVCTKPCLNGICTAPDKCECLQGYTNDSFDVCHPICTLECVFGTCTAPNVCTCLEGYVLEGNSTYKCSPICSDECINAYCSEPENCTCFDGFEPQENSTNFCQPKCLNKCINGICTPSGTCECFDGFVLSGKMETCNPVPNSYCKTDICTELEECKCYKGHDEDCICYVGSTNNDSREIKCWSSCHNECKNNKCSELCDCNNSHQSNILFKFFNATSFSYTDFPNNFFSKYRKEYYISNGVIQRNKLIEFSDVLFQTVVSLKVKCSLLSIQNNLGISKPKSINALCIAINIEGKITTNVICQFQEYTNYTNYENISSYHHAIENKNASAHLQLILMIPESYLLPEEDLCSLCLHKSLSKRIYFEKYVSLSFVPCELQHSLLGYHSSISFQEFLLMILGAVVLIMTVTIIVTYKICLVHRPTCSTRDNENKGNEMEQTWFLNAAYEFELNGEAQMSDMDNKPQNK